MPDSIKIGIEAVDNTAAGISSATSNLQRLEGNLKGFGTTTTNARAIMDGWTKSQYAAAIAGDNLTIKALQLEKAVNSGKMTVQEATSAYKAFEKQQKANVWQAMSFGEKYGIVSRQVNDSVKAIGGVALKFGAMAAGVGYATKQVYDFGKQGATIEYTAQKFDRLAASVGTTGDVFIKDLRAATMGTVSDFGLLKMGSDLLQLGLAADATEATRLSRVMTALGMDTGELTLALANQSKRRLDQLGLSLSKFNEIEARLKGTGMTKEERFKEAFLQTAEQTVLTTGNRANSAMAPYLQLEAGWANLVDQVKIGAGQALSGDVQNFANLFRAMNAVSRGEMQWTGNLFELLTTNGPVLERAYYDQGQVTNPYAANAQMAAAYGYGVPGVSRGGRGREMIRNASDYSQMAAHYRRPEAAAAAEAIPPNYEMLLQGGMQLTNMTEDYNAKSAELNAELTKQTDILAQMELAYVKGSEKLVEQQEKVQGLKDKVTDLNTSYTDAMNNMGLSTLKAAEASDEQQLQFARASGMISQDAYETQSGLNKVAEAFKGGKISADDYASAVKNVTSWAQGLSNQQFDVFIDVWIRKHGSLGYLGPGANTATTNKGIEALREETGGGRASGGPLYPGLTIVGEGPTGWSPTAEVIADGYVYSHKEAQAMKDAGLLEGAARHWRDGPLENTLSSGTARPAGGLRIPRGKHISSTTAKSLSGGSLGAALLSGVTDAAMTAATAAIQATGGGAQASQQAAIAQAQQQAQITSQNETNALLQQLIAIQSGQARDIGRSVAEANVQYK